MPVIPSTSIIHVEIQTQLTITAGGSNAKRFDNVYNFKRTSNVLAVSKTQIESAFQAAIMVPVMAALSTRAAQVYNYVRFIDDATDAPQAISRAVTGSISGDSLTGRDAVSIELKTDYRGRSGRGSKHYGPLGESQVVGDVLESSAVTLFNTIAAAILAGFTDAAGNVWVPEVLIRNPVDPALPRSQLRTNPTTVLANQVTSVILNKTVGTMNRRRVQRVTA